MQKIGFHAAFFTAASRPDLTDELYRFRHALFVDELGWSVTAGDGRERDEFDTGHALYCSLRCDGKIIGCFRAVPCDRPYLARSVFPHLATRRGFPVSPDYVEVSRFGVLAAHRQASLMLYSLMVRFALSRNATALVALAELAHERLLNRIGLPTSRYGDCQIVGFRQDGGWILAVAGEIRMPVSPDRAFKALLDLTQTMDISDDASVFGYKRLSA